VESIHECVEHRFILARPISGMQQQHIEADCIIEQFRANTAEIYGWILRIIYIYSTYIHAQPDSQPADNPTAA